MTSSDIKINKGILAIQGNVITFWDALRCYLIDVIHFDTKYIRQSNLIWKLNNKCWYPSIIICIPRNIEPVQKLSMIWSKLYQLSILCAPLFYVWTYHLNHSPVQILALVTRFQIIDIIWVIIIVVETLMLHASALSKIIKLWTWLLE